jgi:chromosome segregation ATPase
MNSEALLQQLRDENARLREENTALRQTVAGLREELAVAEERLAELERGKKGPPHFIKPNKAKGEGDKPPRR